MPIYKNWQDFDKMRDKSKVLVIYGAGAIGLSILNHNGVIPDYFCDKNAKKIKNIIYKGIGDMIVIKVLTLKKLLAELNLRDADILVSNINEKNIKDIHRIFNKAEFTKNTVIYFHYLYDILIKKITKPTVDFCIINNKIIAGAIKRFGSIALKLYNNTDFLLKSAYLDGTFASTNEFEKFIENESIGFIFKEKRLYEIYNNIPVKTSETYNYNKAIYFFCDSRFRHRFCKIEHGIEFMLLSLLNANNEKFQIENYSVGAFTNEKVIFQLTSVPLIKNSIVIINRIENPYLLAIAKQYCRKYECRLIYYFTPSIYFRNIFTNYEKWLVENNENLFKKNEEDNLEILKLFARAMDIEFYEPPDEFLNSDKTIYLDIPHFGYYGNEIVAKHLHDIIINKVKCDNFCNDFYLKPREKIKYALAVIPIMVPDIQGYLVNLKKYKQEFENCGAIVMNCNPFTLGHGYLIVNAEKLAFELNRH